MMDLKRAKRDSAERNPAKEVKKLVESLTTSGAPTPDEAESKKLRKICKSDEAALPFVFDLLFIQLGKPHCQIRLSAFQLLDQLFVRSHVFRERVVAQLQTVLDLVVETDLPLPPPRAAREALKKLSLERIRDWVKTFGPGYKKLSLGYNYLKQVKKVDFNDLEARSAIQRQLEDERKRKADKIWRDRIKKVKAEMEESLADIQDCSTQIRNCVQLLVPDLDSFGLNDDEEEEAKEEAAEDDNAAAAEDEEDASGMNSMRAHGILSASSGGVTLTLDGSGKGNQLRETSDNSAVLDNLRDQYNLLNNRLLPLVKKWAVILTKSGAENCDSDTLKRVIDLKQILEEGEGKAAELLTEEKKKRRERRKGQRNQDGDGQEGEDSDSDDDDSDDDFVEVPEKSDFEAEAPEMDTLLGIPFYPAPSGSRSKLSQSSSAQDDPQPSGSGTQQRSKGSKTSSSWMLSKVSKEESSDPTTLSATLSKLHKEGKLSGNSSLKASSSSSSSTTQRPLPADPGEGTSSSSSGSSPTKLNSLAPRLPFDVDLMNWGEKLAPRKVIVDSERLRFWGGSASRDDEEMIVPGSDATVRNIEFAGKFEPVRWSCRAPLPKSGRLCPRRDRYKCPLHGKIIPRDNAGNPANALDKFNEDLAKEKAAEENPEWQDPELLRELKEATGVDLKIPKKGQRLKGGGGKNGSKRYPGLTDLKETSNTVRNRLEKKVFNKRSLKRVAADLDSADARRVKHKFADQFNYT